MIYVDRSQVPVPEVLTSPRANAEREKIAKLLSGSREHLEQTRIRFEPKIWLGAKHALFELFHGKCAYCESEIVGEVGEIHHFRPKSGVEHSDGARSHYYYAWLAYDWENLLLVCQSCNITHGKRSLFPVNGDRAPLLASVDECRKTEKYALLDPCFDRPEEHLTFEETGECLALSRRGKITIDVLNLNRSPLIQERRKAWFELKATLTYWLLSQSVGHLTDLESLTRTLSKGPHTGLARVVLKEFAPEFRNRGVNIDALLEKAEPSQVAKPDIAELRLVTHAPDVTITQPQTRFADRKQLPPRAYAAIRRIEIKNFKGIETIDFDLRERSPDEEESPPMLMLLGENATGKSSVLEAVALALLGANETAKLGLNGHSFVRRPSQAEPSEPSPEPADITIYFQGEEEPVHLTIDPQSGQFEGNSELATVLLGYGPRRFFSDRRRSRRLDQPSARVRTLFDPLAVISNPTSWLMNCNDTNFNAAIRAFRELLLLPEEAHVSRPPRGERRGKEIMFEIQGEPEPLRRLSEGYKTTIATAVDIMREMLEYWPDLESARGVVLIDELDTHLHPRWKMRIVQRLREAMPLVQFIATTHDPLCLRGLADGEVQVLRRNENNRIERVNDLPNVRGLSVEQLLTSEFFGLFSTEDPKFEEDMSRYVALSTKHQLSQEEQTELEYYRNLVHDTITLGSTPQRRLVQDAAREYLLEQRRTPPEGQAALKQAAVRQIIDLWKSAPAGDLEQ